jgi:uncharacterized membrane protein YhaH (DUF805 family)
MAFNWVNFLFSPHGRVPRSWYWLRFILPCWGIELVLTLWQVSSLVDTRYDREVQSVILSVLPLFLVSLLVLWPSLIIGIKRWHDRDKSGWFVLVPLIPVVGPIWALVECGFLPGTSGPNRYGPDPLAGAGAWDAGGTLAFDRPSGTSRMNHPGGEDWVLSGLDGSGYAVRVGFSVATLGSAGLSIGRHSSSDLVLHDSLVSRHHARVFHGTEGLVIEDLGSANGTFVGGIRLREASPVPLTAGVEIRFGSSSVLTLSRSQPGVA